MFLIPGTILAWHITKILLCFIRWQVNSYIFTAPAWTYCKTYCRTAYDVTINDDSWPTEAFELVTGEKSKTLERLDPWVHFVMHLFAIGVGSTENDFITFTLAAVPQHHTHLSWKPKHRAGSRVRQLLLHTVFPPRPLFRFCLLPLLFPHFLCYASCIILFILYIAIARPMLLC